MASLQLPISALKALSGKERIRNVGSLSRCITPTLNRNISSSSKVATTSQVTLAHYASNHQMQRHSSILSTPKRPTNASYHFNRTRSMATITRQPDQPEDPEVFSDNTDPTIIISETATNHLDKVSKKENNPNLALRISVEAGGCHGYQYKMELTDEMEEDDFRFSVQGKDVHILVDSTSLRLIKGSTIDYVTELIGSQFAIFNNPQAKGAGCGCGVSWEPNI